MHALVIENLRKVYDNGVEALKGIDLTVREGDFFALLGPNGAGDLRVRPGRLRLPRHGPGHHRGGQLRPGHR
jgi:ABC-type uncharacterized transport system ATPase subunit